MLDSIKKIDAFAYNGKTYPSETAAIIAAVASRIGNNEAIARNITDSAKDLIPLLQRIVELQAPDPAIPPETTANTTPETTVRLATEAELSDVIESMRSRKEAAKVWLEEQGCTKLADWIDRKPTLNEAAMWFAQLDHGELAGTCDCSATMAGNSGPHHPTCPSFKPNWAAHG